MEEVPTNEVPNVGTCMFHGPIRRSPCCMTTHTSVHCLPMYGHNTQLRLDLCKQVHLHTKHDY